VSGYGYGGMASRLRLQFVSVLLCRVQRLGLGLGFKVRAWLVLAFLKNFDRFISAMVDTI